MLDDDTTTAPTNSDEVAAVPPESAAPAKKAARKAPAKRTTKKAAAKATEAAAEPTDASATDAAPATEDAPVAKKAAKKAPAKKAAAKKTAAKKTTKKAAAADAAQGELIAEPESADTAPAEAAPAPAKKAAAKKAAAKKAPAKKAAKKAAAPVAETAPVVETAPEAAAEPAVAESAATEAAAAEVPLFLAPEAAPVRRTRSRKKAVAAPAETEATAEAAAEPAVEATPEVAEGEVAEAPKKPARKRAARKPKAEVVEPVVEVDEATVEPDAEEGDEAQAEVVEAENAEATADAEEASDSDAADGEHEDDDSEEGNAGTTRRRRRRGGRRRRKSSDSTDSTDSAEPGDATDNADHSENAEGDETESGDEDEQGEGTSSRRRRRRRRAGEGSGDSSDDPANTVTRVRQSRTGEDQITAVSGSTRLEAKKQRRREGREAGRRRAPIVSEAEFLARRESVERVMVIRQRGELTQIGVLEDKVLVEHYVSRESQNSMIGNVYVGRVQNVLPSMEAAFVDIGKGRNAVLYAGEVNWSALGHREGQPRKIESVLSSGQSVLVQVSKDPVGHKGARLTSQISLAGRFLVYVPDGTTSGISRKLPDTERARLKTLLKEIVPDSAGVIVRTAAEGASEEELTQDVERLKARWEDIEAKSKQGSAPKLLYGEPDLTLKVVRDLFTEDFAKLVIDGDDAWETVQGYVSHIAPDLEERLERYQATETSGDAFAAYRIDEQIAKGLDRKVWLPSGGSLIIDRTEAMTVVDVNTGKFTGSGGNLEETVTKNNLEAAEEIVRQLRLRDIGGIIVVDFIDMVLESNRDLVLRRMVECLGRDRTRHQVAEVTSLGLVQMTRKRIGTGLLEAFSENCEHCNGRGLTLHDMPIEPKKADDDAKRGNRRSRKGKGEGDQGRNDQGRNDQHNDSGRQQAPKPPSPKDVAAAARHDHEHDHEQVVVEAADAVEPTPAAETVETAEAPVVQTSSRSSRRSRRNRSADNAANTARPEADAAPVEQPPVSNEAPSSEAPSNEAPSAPTTTVTTTQVTRTRRGARSAGVITPKASEPIVVAAPAPVEVAAAPVAPPTVTTRTRGRRAVEAPAEETAGDQAELHVPIKKKGSRKR
ncbi:Rne/Rng family ribonuclease [Nocardioides sp. Bht2]|uniref:Rne/Rng family ribonuclease n=1 Tax=Nocardioides sp. Bht2 TaxID=3392297 RepID=UPI0039B52C35